jgi:Tfp pilus assembly protein PilN
MIEINLLPQELKIKKQKSLDLEPKIFLKIFLLFLGLLIMAHMYLVVWGIFKGYQFYRLNAEWQKLSPQRKELDKFKQEYEFLSQDSRIIQQLAGQRINWSEKLNKLSLSLPSGVWFNEITLLRKDFTLKGSAVSLKKDEMSLINRFMQDLKNDAEFFKDFSTLELNSFQVKNVGGYDTVEFILQATLK